MAWAMRTVLSGRSLEWESCAVLQRFEKDLAAAEGVGAVSVEAKPRMQVLNPGPSY